MHITGNITHTLSVQHSLYRMVYRLVFQADYRGWLLLLAARLLLAVFLRTDHLLPSKTSSINGYKYILPYFLVQPRPFKYRLHIFCTPMNFLFQAVVNNIDRTLKDEDSDCFCQ